MRYLALVPLVLLLAGCAPTIALEPAADAINTACAEVSVRLPDTVDGQDKRLTNAQATGAWGEPASAILRCGVPVPAPTAELPCITVEGIDWLIDDKDAPSYVFTTYGRDPAVEVHVPASVAAEQSTSFLDELGPAISLVAADRTCV